MRTLDFEAKKILGNGNYTLVYQVTWKGDKKKERNYALKRYFLRSPDTACRTLREYNNLRRLTDAQEAGLNSPFLPTLYAAFHENTSIVFVMTLGIGVDLSAVLNNYRPLPLSAVKFYSAEILCGLEHLHALKILHVDIKPQNILITRTNHIMITDFDHSIDISKGPTHHGDRMAGTCYYRPPEVANSQKLDEKADIWTWAAVLIELIGRPIRSFRLPTPQVRKLAEQGWVRLPEIDDSPELMELAVRCFQFNPQERPSIGEIKLQPFFRDVNWDDATTGRLKPPIKLTEKACRPVKFRYIDKHHNQSILANLHEPDMIDVEDTVCNPDGTWYYRKRVQRFDDRWVNMEPLLATIDYVHPREFAEESSEHPSTSFSCFKFCRGPQHQ